ncbi:MAG: hypothetical protein LBJ61_01510, partial [Deltaproteobacteria bacterium]|nr:hypothetical protein [Deltaproteobacteria bacterium]
MENTLTISNADTLFDVYGGYTIGGTSATASENTLTISNAVTIESVYGGFAYGGTSGTASENTLTISNADTLYDVYGGYAEGGTSGTASENTLTISNADTIEVVYGGYAFGVGSATASENTLTISNADTIDYAYGGMAESYNDVSTASYNTITFRDVETTGYVFGGLATSNTGSATAEENSIGIEGNSTTISGTIYGGLAVSGGLTTIKATKNSLTISGSPTLNNANLTGGYAFSSSISGGAIVTATNNALTISGSPTLNNANLTGGFAYSASTSGGAVVTATNNALTISGSPTLTDANLYGGYVRAPSATAITATNNAVTISGTPILTGANIFGGLITGSGDAVSGNSLTLRTSGRSVNSISNFEYLKFYLPNAIADGDTVMAANTADIDNSIVSVTVESGPSSLKIGDRVKLIEGGVTANIVSKGEELVGLVMYDFDVAVNNSDLIATLSGAKANETTKSLSEGFAAGLSGLNQTADLFTGAALTNAVEAVGSNLAGGVIWAPFMAMAGGTVRHETGSHVDYSGVSMVLGVSAGVGFQSGQAVFGAFAEVGRGNYETYNFFPSVGDVWGEGDTNHLGGGIMA